MSDRVSETSGWSESFQQQFDDLTPLILSEWQQLDAETLAYTEGNLDLVVDYIATQTDHTRTLVHHHLGELHSVLRQTAEQPEVAEKSEAAVESATAQRDLVETALKAFEHQAEALISRLERKVLPSVESDRDRDKLNNSLMTVFGIGFVLGMIFGGWGRGRR